MLIDPRAVALHEPVEQSAPHGLAGGPAISSLLVGIAALVALRATKVSPALLVLAGAVLGIVGAWVWR